MQPPLSKKNKEWELSFLRGHPKLNSKSCTHPGRHEAPIRQGGTNPRLTCESGNRFCRVINRSHSSVTGRAPHECADLTGHHQRHLLPMWSLPWLNTCVFPPKPVRGNPSSKVMLKLGRRGLREATGLGSGVLKKGRSALIKQIPRAPSALPQQGDDRLTNQQAGSHQPTNCPQHVVLLVSRSMRKTFLWPIRQPLYGISPRSRVQLFRNPMDSSPTGCTVKEGAVC